MVDMGIKDANLRMGYRKEGMDIGCKPEGGVQKRGVCRLLESFIFPSRRRYRRVSKGGCRRSSKG